MKHGNVCETLILKFLCPLYIVISSVFSPHFFVDLQERCLYSIHFLLFQTMMLIISVQFQGTLLMKVLS